MNGLLDLMSTKDRRAKNSSLKASLNVKRGPVRHNKDLPRLVKKLKQDQVIYQEDHQLVQDTKRRCKKKAISLEDSLSNSSNEKVSLPSGKKRTKKRRRFGNWLREIASHVCKVIKLRLLSVEYLSKTFIDDSGYDDQTNEANLFAKNLPQVSSDIFQSVKLDNGGDPKEFIAFLDGFRRIKRNTFKMTGDYVKEQPVFGEKFTRAVLNFIPECDVVPVDSRYSHWINASSRMQKSTKDSLLDPQVRAAITQPLRKLYKSLCESNQNCNDENEVSSLTSETRTESKVLIEIGDYMPKLNMAEGVSEREDNGPDDLLLVDDKSEVQKMMKTEVLINKEEGRVGNSTDDNPPDDQCFAQKKMKLETAIKDE